MSQKNIEMMESKRKILEDIKKLYRIKPITAIIVTIFTILIFMIFTGTVMAFGKNLKSDYFAAISNLFLIWNLGFGLYQGIWRFSNSRKINKLLFLKLEQFINKSGDKSYDETEIEVYEMVKLAYGDYTEKYNKLNKIYWFSLKLSVGVPLIALIIGLVINKI
ncbi:hypothetical protein [Bacillus sp. AFS053548]|uniref:hypothetical protein n=1 Tax=Bacillus sp. AFS053548 TaxID=2033505 RepID=UPI000BFC83EC|nr:hypothetical protein [Bacillus sp. AFS053548]PGM49028.1 hypothetical protein CN946_22750 [Bacillus sp. AFS053548]